MTLHWDNITGTASLLESGHLLVQAHMTKWILLGDKKKKEILPLATAWIDPESIMLSEISQRKTSTIWLHSYVYSNEQNQLTNKIEADSENRLTAVRGEGVESLDEKVKGLSKKQKTTLIDTDNIMVVTRRKGSLGEVEEGKWEIKWWWKETWLWVVHTQYNTVDIL